MPKQRPYLYYDQTISLCEHCLTRVEAKHVIQDDQVWLYKWCPHHGQSKTLIATDAAYWRLGREVYIKAPEMPARFSTEMHWGCPYDCGLCPDHMQHSCLTLLEITDQCNLQCPVCYADSSPARQKMRSLAQIETMLDAIVANEGSPDVVQISGGEPTLHPELFAILDAAKRRPIKHLMLNTNGLRIANESGFAEKLAQYAPGFEIYLQFDSFEKEALLTLRGADLRAIRNKALAHLNRVGLSTTLVMTIGRGINDHEIGKLVEYAAKQPCVRGVTLQPIQFAGRLQGPAFGKTASRHPTSHASARLTHTEVRQKLLQQSQLFTPEDIIPVPCNPDALSMGYALKIPGNTPHTQAPQTEQAPPGIQPLTRFIPPEILLEGSRNTLVFEYDPTLKARVFQLFATNHGPEGQSRALADLLCCLPRIQLPEQATTPSLTGPLGYQNVFRVLIMAFMDAANFDVRAMKKSCVHIVQEDGKMIPFEAFNLLYREGRQHTLQQLRQLTDEQHNREKTRLTPESIQISPQ